MNFSKDLIVAIDGYSSCGKSTFAKAIASRMNYIFIDTGAMYRAVTLAAIRKGALGEDTVDVEAVEKLLKEINISFRFNPERGASDIYINEECVENQIRTLEVSGRVSDVSALPAVRSKLTSMQQNMGRRGGVVMDGRDIGTAVFPDAPIKIFMCASSAVRAQRRYEELKAKGDEVSLEQIVENIEKRDIADESRAVAPLRRADNAVLLDNSLMTPDEQMTWFFECFKQILYV